MIVDPPHTRGQVLRGQTVPILRLGPCRETQWAVAGAGAYRNLGGEFRTISLRVMFQTLLLLAVPDLPLERFEVTEPAKAGRFVLALSIPREEDLEKG